MPHSPVAYAYVVVELETASLFVNEPKVTAEVAAHLNEAGVTVKPYTSLVSDIKRLGTFFTRFGAQLFAATVG